MVAEKLLIDAREKIRNCVYLQAGLPEWMTFCTQFWLHKIKRKGILRYYTLCTDRGRQCTWKTVKKFVTDYCWKCDGGPWVCRVKFSYQIFVLIFCMLFLIESDALLDSPALPIRWITLDMRGDFCNIVPDVQDSFCWTWIWVYSCIRLFLLWGLNLVHQCTFYFWLANIGSTHDSACATELF